MYGSANTPLKIPIARGNESDQICKEKAEDNGFGSIRSMRKIEDRPRPRPESGRTATIPQANRERSVRAEDTIEVIDQATPPFPPPPSLPFHFQPKRLSPITRIMLYVGHTLRSYDA